MSDTLQQPWVAPRKEDPESLALRGSPRPAVRFRRGLIVGGVGSVAALVVALSWFALEPTGLRKAASAVDGAEPAGAGDREPLADVPGDYGKVPRLGPPLPGDLGPPILEHERSLADEGLPAVGPVAPGAAGAAATAGRDRALSEREAARTAPVLVQLGGAPTTAPVPDAAAPEAPQLPSGSSAVGIPASQQRKIDFARGDSEGDVNPDPLQPPPSPWTLAAGTVIPASLITGLQSDLPGIVLAQVTENVRDSATGRTILVPQGARLVGRYDSVIAYGQRRALLVWTRLLLPDGSSVRLDNMPAADTSGYAGLEDRVDSHSWQLLKGIALSTLLGVGTQLSFGGRGDLVRAIRQSAQQTAANAGNQITSRNLDVQPTIKVRPGWPVRVIVNKDLVLQPWRG